MSLVADMHALQAAYTLFRIAQRIDFLMRKNNLSKSDLARGLDKDPAQISRWMSGVHNFSLKTLAELEIFFAEHILISPTAVPETAEYTQYIAEQTEKKRARVASTHLVHVSKDDVFLV